MINRFLFILILMILPREKYKINSRIYIKFNVRDENNIPIKDAKISIRAYKSKKIINILTCYRGRALTSGICKNTYKITISKKGYTEKTFIIKAFKNINCNISLCHINTNRIYGYITDINNRVVNKAIVVLYKVISKKVYIPKKFTYTDFTGEYNFFNIPKGKYIIKAIK